MTTDSPPTEYAQWVDRYKELRTIARRLNGDVLPRYLSKRAFETCGRKLGLMQGDTLFFADMDHSSVLMDYCLHDYADEGGTAVSRYLADAQEDLPCDEYAVVKAMVESFYTLVLVGEVLAGVGAGVVDLLTGREYLLIDMGLSETAVKGLVIATRLLPYGDFVTTSGAPLPVDGETLVEIRDSILPQFETVDEGCVQTAADRRADWAAAIIRLCLNKEPSTRMEYRDIADEPVVCPVQRETRVGRNDPCPCGSGRKYKKCCGR